MDIDVLRQFVDKGRAFQAEINAMGFGPPCQHRWSEPQRANNRFGRLSTSLYETTCSRCGKHEVRNGKARLIREVICG